MPYARMQNWMFIVIMRWTYGEISYPKGAMSNYISCLLKWNHFHIEEFCYSPQHSIFWSKGHLKSVFPKILRTTSSFWKLFLENLTRRVLARGQHSSIGSATSLRARVRSGIGYLEHIVNASKYSHSFQISRFYATQLLALCSN